VRVLLATDSFPPRCGGSGWSTYELARGLRALGHDVIVVQPKPGERQGQRERQYEGIRTIEHGFPAPSIPYVRNYFKNERLYPALGEVLAQIAEREHADIVHGQHVLTSLPAVAAARKVRIPSVVTVRDYWPVCYWSDLIYSSTSDDLCPGCSAAMMARCIRPRSGALWPLAVPMIPYMRANLARKRSGLAAADAVIAVSSTIAADLRTRAPEIARTRLEMIPNPVNIAAIRADAAAAAPPLQGPYALYLGKLAPNKGTSHLVQVAECAGLEWPLVIVGDGPDRSLLEEVARRSSRDIRLVGWVDRQQATAWLAHASLLVFTSRGPESLSRVLLEASALGVPIAAINTGGTPDIVRHGETGLLSTSPAALADDVQRLAADAALRHELGTAAARWVSQTFGAEAIVKRVEELYRDLLQSASTR
jgi:glycosyltransferase involved in cell wall biosynthesis